MRKRIGLMTLIACLASAGQAQVLVTVGDRAVTSDQLEKALKSSPFSTQFPTLDEKEQAQLRGDMLQRLVDFEVLLLEAQRLGVDQTSGFLEELRRFENGLLAQRYLQTIREGIDIPPAQQDRWREQFGPDLDALSAARSLYIARRYDSIKADRLSALKKNDGDRDETALWAKAARHSGIEVKNQVAGYKRELMVQKLLEAKEEEWIPDETILRDYYQIHPEIGHVPERRRIGQIVVASREKAETLRRRIEAGESLFKLAADYSLDSYGRNHAGDMGWLPAGKGMPQLEKALTSLPDDTVSDVIKTPRGFHLLMIIDRRPAEQKAFAEVKDRVRRAFLAEKRSGYLADIRTRHPIQWHLPVSAYWNE